MKYNVPLWIFSVNCSRDYQWFLLKIPYYIIMKNDPGTERQWNFAYCSKILDNFPWFPFYREQQASGKVIGHYISKFWREEKKIQERNKNWIDPAQIGSIIFLNWPPHWKLSRKFLILPLHKMVRSSRNINLILTRSLSIRFRNWNLCITFLEHLWVQKNNSWWQQDVEI